MCGFGFLIYRLGLLNYVLSVEMLDWLNHDFMFSIFCFVIGLIHLLLARFWKKRRNKGERLRVF
jgi:hypothetical protein